MTFENITENSVLNAAGRLVDPGKKIFMGVEYYAAHKDFIDGYVDSKKAKIDGIKEYEDFVKNGQKGNDKEDEKKVDLMDEVLEEEKAKEEPENEEKSSDKPAEDANTEEEKVEEKPVPKKTSRRRKTAPKTEE